MAELKQIEVDGIDYEIPEPVWSTMLSVSLERDELRKQLMFVELNQMFGIKESRESNG